MAFPTLISDHVGTNPIITSERNAQHSHLTMWEHIPQPCQKGQALASYNQCHKGQALTFDHARNQSNIHVERDLHLHSTMRGTNPTYMLKRICTYIWHMWGINPKYMFKRALHLHLHMRGTNPARMSEGLALTSDHVWTNPIVISEWPPVPDWATW